MKTKNNTVLITGGSKGIGFEIAKRLLAAGNTVIITGRDRKRLDQALQHLPGATGIAGDVSDPADTESLVARVSKDHPDLNLVINNAGAASVYNIGASDDAFGKAQEEMLTNYLAVIRLNEKLLPLLKRQPEAAIVNVSSVVAIVPGSLATYSASKAALHSYTQSLRIALGRNSKVQVFELMPPLVDTEFSAPINGKTGIPPSDVADQLIKGIEAGQYEIRVGKTQDIYELFLKSPDEALSVMQPA